MKLDHVGIWSEIKLEIIKKYANAYTSIMKKQSWCKGYVYIDAFAGAGQHISRRTGARIRGVRSCQAVEKLTSNKDLPVIKLCFPCIPEKFSEHGNKFFG